ncbi:MAG: chorismate mutase [Candidatus Izemoplasmatales bacterium]|jgi:monofunctional chorismate mutase
MEELRKQIDEIDQTMLELFVKRMNLSKEIVLKKKTLGLKIYDLDREKQILTSMTKKIDDEIIAGLYPQFITNLMDLSKIYQRIIAEE